MNERQTILNYRYLEVFVKNLNKFYFNNEHKMYLRFIEISKKNIKAQKGNEHEC